MGNVKETVLEINLAHLTHNFKYLKSKVGPKVKMLAVVKASGYGSDAVVIAKHLEKLGTDYFAVAYVSEGIALRESGVQTPILVLHPQPVNFQKLIEYQLEPSLYSARTLKGFIATATALGQKSYPVHIKFNTGLNRVGFRQNDIDYIVGNLNKTSAIKVVAILSHLAASEDLSERGFTLKQIRSFKKTAKTISDILGYTPILHQSNTSGILNGYQRYYRYHS